MGRYKKKAISCINVQSLSNKEKYSLEYTCYSGNETEPQNIQTFLSLLHSSSIYDPSCCSGDISDATDNLLKDKLVIDYSALPDVVVQKANELHSKHCIVECLQAQGVSSTAFLNIGFPVWSMDFSPIFRSEDSNEDEATVLAVAGSTFKQPLFPAMPPSTILSDTCVPLNCVIEFWKVPLNALHKSRLVVFLVAKGGHCRCIRWMRHSGLRHKSIGLLFVARGDGMICCFSMPQQPFNNPQKPVLLRLSPIWKTNITYFLCVSPAPYFSFMLNQTFSADPSLRFASGSKDGRVHIWCFQFMSEAQGQVFKGFCQAEITVCDQIPITSITWYPHATTPLIAVGTLTGIIKLWYSTTLSMENDGCLYQIENMKRPVYQVCWPQITRFLYACHTNSCVFDSVTKEFHQRASSTFLCSSVRSEQPPWGCASLAHLALFACDSGELFIYPVHKLGRNPEAHQWVNTWKLCEMNPPDIDKEAPNEMIDSYERIDCIVNSFFNGKAENTEASHIVSADLLRQYYHQALKAYSKSMITPQRDKKLVLTFQVAKPSPQRKLKKSTTSPDASSVNKQDQEEDLEMSSCRLHAVCTLDPSVYPNMDISIIAVGGSLGIIYIFCPSSLQIF